MITLSRVLSQYIAALAGTGKKMTKPFSGGLSLDGGLSLEL